MFGTLMKCPENEKEAIEIMHKMEEDASRWGQCDEESGELEDSDEVAYDDIKSNDGARNVI